MRKLILLVVRGEYRLRMADNGVIRRIFRPMMEDVTRWRYLHNYELRNLYCSPYIKSVIESRRMRLEGHAVRMRNMINSYQILVRKPEEMGPLGRIRRLWESRKKGLKNRLGKCGRIRLQHGREQWWILMNTVIKLGFNKCWKFLSSWARICF
jgi:hypothetical protein